MSIEDTRKRAVSLDLNEVDPLAVTASTCFVLIVDAQNRLIPAIDRADAVTAGLDRLLRAADLLEVPVRATEHCAEAIGDTIPVLRERLGAERCLAKRSFDATAEPGLLDQLRALQRPIVLVAGVEAHVCVAQTALGLIRAGFRVAVVEDACGSRRPVDRNVGLARMRAAGAVPLTVEAAIFEWLGTADHPAFREVLAIVKEG